MFTKKISLKNSLLRMNVYVLNKKIKLPYFLDNKEPTFFLFSKKNTKIS